MVTLRDYMMALCLLGLAACGQAPDQRNVAAEYATYVEKFEAILGHPIGFSVVTGDLDARYAGQCELFANGKKVVTISAAYLRVATALEIEGVVMHELGHCELLRGHDDSRRQLPGTGVHQAASSVMNTYAFGGWQLGIFRTNLAYYYEELFSGPRGGMLGARVADNNVVWQTGADGGCGGKL